MPVKSFKPRHHSGASGRKFNGRRDIDNLYWGSPEWREYRLRFLAENPRCYSCGVVATEVDHLRPHKGDEKLFKQLDNHLPLCERCHGKVTGLFDRRFSVGGSIDSKIKWLQLSRLSNGLTFRVRVLPYYGLERL